MQEKAIGMLFGEYINSLFFVITIFQAGLNAMHYLIPANTALPKTVMQE
jgi:hypothetical protein